MTRNELIGRLEQLHNDEESRVVCNPHKQHRVALLYPNTYFVGMSNLGMQIIYKEINERPQTVAERVFLPEPKELKDYEKWKLPLMSVESRRPLDEFHVIGFAVTFEMDYFHIPKMLKMGRVPVRAEHRIEGDPFVLAGGPCATFNPEPLSDFIDAFIIGEGEELIDRVLDIIEEGRWDGRSRRDILWDLSQLDGVYVPRFYEPQFEAGRFTGYVIESGAPEQIYRHWKVLDGPAETVVVTDYTEFGAMYLVEVARGCGRHCRFCMAGYCYRTPRVRSVDLLKEGVDRALSYGKKVGLMGAAISDYPYIDELVNYIRSHGGRYSCASLRADSLTADVVQGLVESGQKTITIAPEAGSERLRRVINKGISEEDMRKAVSLAAAIGVPHMRLYIMVGLPTETDEDIDAIIDLAKKTLGYMDEYGCKGKLTLSVNPFIPKPFTPFQWLPMAPQKEVTKKLDYIKKSLRPFKRIEILAESPKEAYVQGVLARGDRRLGRVLEWCAQEKGHKSFKEGCQRFEVSMEDALYAPLEMEESLPWSVLNMHLGEGYLEREYRAGVEEKYTVPCQEGCKRCGVCT